VTTQLQLNKSNVTSHQNFLKKKSRLINDQNINSFQQFLKVETWNQVYNSSCSNEIFNKFQEIFLRYYEANFPVIHVNCRPKQNNWITKGIRISCIKKRTFPLVQKKRRQYPDKKNRYINTVIY
jgi:hypothetical protein